MSQTSDNSSIIGGRYSQNVNNYTYENENFFETNNDNLIEIKNIFENKFFWERINTFFEIKIHPEEVEILNNFY